MALDLKFALLCDYAAVGANGKPIAVHIFEHFTKSDETLANPLPRFSILARLECSIADGTTHALEMIIEDEDGKVLGTMAFPPTQFIAQGPGLPLAAGYTMQVDGLKVPGYGTYQFVFKLASQRVGSVIFNVVKLPTTGVET